MRNSKTIGAVMIALFVLSAMLIQAPNAVTVNTSDATAKEKLTAFLSDIIGLDLTQYNVTNEGYSVSYPSRFGGVVKEEHLSFTLNSNDYKITVSSVFDNGFPWIRIRVLNGSLIYATQPSNDALVNMRNIIQRYQVFAEKYSINAVNVTAALNLLSNVPDAPLIDVNSTNFNGMSYLTPTNTTSGDMKLEVSQKSIAFWYTINDINVKNKYFGINFANGAFHFWDSWNLYSIGSFSVLSKEEATNMAFDVAKAYSLNLTLHQTDKNNVATVVKPDWSQMRSDVSFNMIPGQTYNNSLNDALIAKGVGVNTGNTTRNPLALYPFWSTIFFFTKPIGNIAGIQVGLWGDTKEIAYCTEYGYLGGSTSTDEAFDSTPTLPENQALEEQRQEQPSISDPSVIAAVIIVPAIFAVLISAVVLRHRKQRKH